MRSRGSSMAFSKQGGKCRGRVRNMGSGEKRYARKAVSKAFLLDHLSLPVEAALLSLPRIDFSWRALDPLKRRKSDACPMRATFVQGDLLFPFEGSAFVVGFRDSLPHEAPF